MPLHKHQLFERIEDIPDVAPPELIIPSRFYDNRAHQATATSEQTITPVEVSFSVFELGAGSFGVELMALDDYGELGLPYNYLSKTWYRHIARAMFKVAFDPDRYAPFNLVEVHAREFSKFPNQSEAQFFGGFIENWGVLRRESSQFPS